MGDAYPELPKNAERVQQVLRTEEERFAETLERVCVETVESGQMTKDLALLIGPDAPWLTTEKFLEAINANLQKAMAA